MTDALRAIPVTPLVESAPHAIVVVDQEGKIVMINSRAETLFGYRREELIGQMVEVLVPERFRARHREYRREFTSNPTTRPMGAGRDLHGITKDGKEVPIEIGLSSVRTKGGVLILSAIVDISQRKQADLEILRLNETLELRVRERTDELKEIQERLSRLVETIADGIFIVDRSGRITFANAAAEKLLGLSRSDITDRSHDDSRWDLSTPDGERFPEKELPFYRVMLTGEPVYGVEVAVRRADGSRVCVSVNAAPLRDRAGQLTGMVASVSDVTRRKEVERMKDEFVATVSHELRTPLTSLRGFAELMLKRAFTPEKRHEFLTIMRNESVRLTTLINDFLDIQRMEAGSQRYNFAVVDLKPVLRDTVALFGEGERGHRLQLEVPDNLPGVWADADRLRQVISNLVSNALKFSSEASTVMVAARHEDRSVIVRVTDEGVGIAAEALPKLFTKFFRVDDTETRSVGGTGLGLAIVKEIVAAHSGRLWVESQPGKGSTFSFSIPFARYLRPAEPVTRDMHRDTVDIVLVEDDDGFSQLLSEHFEAEGVSVAKASKGEEALDLVLRCDPHVVILDIHLAGKMDGWDFLISLKSNPSSRFLPVLIISASHAINARGLAMGGADYLAKPVSPEWLVDAVRHQLPSLSGMRVLIVDDDCAFRLQVKECLAPEGVEVVESADGREALAAVEERMPDLLLLDLLMPRMDGFELLQELRADKRAMNLPVLVLTAKELLPEDKAYLRRRLATLVRKRDAGVDHIAEAARHMLLAATNRGATRA